MLDTSERQIRTAIAMMTHKILFMDFPFGFVFLFHPQSRSGTGSGNALYSLAYIGATARITALDHLSPEAYAHPLRFSKV